MMLEFHYIPFELVSTYLSLTRYQYNERKLKKHYFIHGEFHDPLV